MEMIRSNEKYNLSIHHESQSSSKVSITNLVKQLRPSSSPLPPPRARSRSKTNQSTEAWPIQSKKQVRRRVHTTKPYQERLLNMAEARKEIVNALKLHRASMKKQQDIIPTLMHQLQSNQQPTFLAKTTQECYTNLSAIGNLVPSLDYPATRVDPSSLQVNQETVFGQSEGGAVEPRGLDEEEMAEIRSVGKIHQMEWDDTLNLVTYALWFKFLHEMDHSEQGDHSLCVANTLV